MLSLSAQGGQSQLGWNPAHMPLFYSIFVFLGSLKLVIGGSMFLSRALGRLGPRLNIPEQLLGFITALGADSPEISAAVVSMISGQQDVAVGVVFGSNLFNLASLLGVTAVIAGKEACVMAETGRGDENGKDPKDQKRGWVEKLRRLIRPVAYLSHSWISRIGVALTTTSAITRIIAYASQILGYFFNPYMGIIIFLILPGVSVA